MRILIIVTITIICILTILLISGIIVFFGKFHYGFSNNPQDWYSVGSFILNLILLLVTITIGVYIYKLTSKTGKLTNQKEIYSEILEIIEKCRLILFNPWLKYKDFAMRTSEIIKRLDELKELSFFFNNEKLADEAIEKYRNKLDDFYTELFFKFGDYSFKQKAKGINKFSETQIVFPLILSTR